MLNVALVGRALFAPNRRMPLLTTAVVAQELPVELMTQVPPSVLETVAVGSVIVLFTVPMLLPRRKKVPVKPPDASVMGPFNANDPLVMETWAIEVPLTVIGPLILELPLLVI